MKGAKILQGMLNDNQSIYVQIANLIESQILKDILLEDEQAPSSNELARIYSINPATAAKGLNILTDKGLLYKKRGLGMFVCKGAKKMIQDQRKNDFYGAFILPLVEEAKYVELDARELQEMIDRALGKK